MWPESVSERVLPGQARWQALVHQAQWALQTACAEMEEYAQARSESWQESERGEAFQERLEAVQEVLAALEELTAVPEKTPPHPLTEDLSCLVRRHNSQNHLLQALKRRRLVLNRGRFTSGFSFVNLPTASLIALSMGEYSTCFGAASSSTSSHSDRGHRLSTQDVHG